MPGSCYFMPNTCIAEAAHGSQHWPIGKCRKVKRGCSVSLDSVFVYLMSINHRAKLTAKVVYICPGILLS